MILGWQPTPRLPPFFFDLDGTLIDSVYQHVLAWREALEQTGLELSVWRIHRRIGMSGGLFVNALMRELGGDVGSVDPELLQKVHGEAYKKLVSQVRPLPGARELLDALAAEKVPMPSPPAGGWRRHGSLSKCWE